MEPEAAGRAPAQSAKPFDRLLPCQRPGKEKLPVLPTRRPKLDFIAFL